MPSKISSLMCKATIFKLESKYTDLYRTSSQKSNSYYKYEAHFKSKVSAEDINYLITKLRHTGVHH